MSESKYIPLEQVMANGKKYQGNKEPKPERISIEAEREKLLGPYYQKEKTNGEKTGS